jgi:hypothetical protein
MESKFVQRGAGGAAGGISRKGETQAGLLRSVRFTQFSIGSKAMSEGGRMPRSVLSAPIHGETSEWPSQNLQAETPSQPVHSSHYRSPVGRAFCRVS